MSKRQLCVILALVIVFIVSGCQDKIQQYETLIVDDYNDIDLDMINHYDIEVDFDPEGKVCAVNQKVTYFNHTDNILESIYFHLYPNTYKSLDTVPILFDDSTLSKGYRPGYIEIESLTVDGVDVKYEIGGEGDTILKIGLGNILNPNDKVEVEFDYIVKLPVNIDRFGYADNVFNFGNWYPIACVYDDTGWNLDPYYNLGDPFYSDIANYDVTITLPEDITVASSGNILEERIKGDNRIYEIEGKLIRDFAWVASNEFVVHESIVHDTVVRLYALKEDENIAEFASRVGRESIEIFNDLFGKYPYGIYSIVMTDFPTGMEYPGIVFISKDYYNERSKEYLEQVIVHETAHQWWYGVVGNDQVDEAWLDEALATYSEVIYILNKYGKERADDYHYYTNELPYEYGKENLILDTGIKKSLNEFYSWEDYGLLVYTKGAMFINEIKDDFGLETLLNILRKYYNTYRFYNATTEEFIEICEEVTGESFDERVNRWLYGKEIEEGN